MRRTQAQRREETRSRLLAAATTVFAEKGFHASGVDDVARAAGCSTGALYAHFGSKADLLLAVLEDNIPRWVQGYAAAMARADTLDGQLEAMVAHWSELVRRVPQGWLLLVELWSSAARDPELRPHFARRYAELRQAVAETLRESMAATGTEPALPAEHLAAVIVGLADGLALQRIADPDAVTDEMFLATIKAAFGATPPAPSRQARRAST